MSDLLEKRLSFQIAVLIAMYWGAVLSIPFLLLDPAIKPKPWVWGFLLVLIAYFLYTGYQAWRRGWKSRFVLRVVVPAALFTAAWIVVWLVM